MSLGFRYESHKKNNSNNIINLMSNNNFFATWFEIYRSDASNIRPYIGVRTWITFKKVKT